MYLPLRAVEKSNFCDPYVKIPDRFSQDKLWISRPNVSTDKAMFPSKEGLGKNSLFQTNLSALV